MRTQELARRRSSRTTIPNSLDKEADGILSKNIVMSYYTSSFTLQNELKGYVDNLEPAI